jgi:predicted ATPase
VHQYRREAQAAQARAESMMRLCEEHGFPFWLAEGAIFQGWALVEQEQQEEGLKHIRQGVSAHRATGVELARPYFLALWAEAAAKVGKTKEAWELLTEALAMVNDKGERMWEAELYRLKGTLVLQPGNVQERQWSVPQLQSSMTKSPHLASRPPAEVEAQAYFENAREIARRRGAKSLELRAAVSLSRLWQQQGRREEARQTLAEICHWFTEGFETKDLQEAKTLLEELT